MDYYSILGISKTADKQEIKKAYRKLAGRHHPDKGGDAEQFKKITEAYEVLSDDTKRQQYDNPDPWANAKRYDSANFNAGAFEDIFSTFFNQQGHRSRQPKNRDITLGTKISLKEAYTGKNLIVTYRLHSGREEQVTLNIPKGANNGDTIRFQGFGDDSDKRFPRGDLNIKIGVLKDSTWQREGDNLYCQKSVNVFDLITGCAIIVTTIEGKSLSVNVPIGTNTGTTFSINGHGMPNVNTGRRGNAYITVHGITPKINDLEIIQKLKEIKNGITTN